MLQLFKYLPGFRGLVLNFVSAFPNSFCNIGTGCQKKFIFFLEFCVGNI